MIQPVGRYWVWRELFSKPIWLNSTVEQQVILMTLIAMANFQANDWEWEGQKFKVDAGQFVTSINSIIENTGGTVSIQNIRSALKRFEKLEFLTVKVTKTGSLITLVNWQSYQPKVNDLTQQPTQSQHRGNTEVTTIEEGKKEKKEKKEDIITPPVIKYLNEKTGKNFQFNVKATQELINARITDGFKIEDLYRVIDIKTVEWLNDSKMSKYLQPSTLFAKTKFEGYLNQGIIKSQTSEKNKDDNYFSNRGEVDG